MVEHKSPADASRLLAALDGHPPYYPPANAQVTPSQPIMNTSLPTISTNAKMHGTASNISRASDVLIGMSSTWGGSQFSSPQPPRHGRTTLDTGGFRLNYDTQSPISRIDVGGPDQQQELEKFFSSSIDNLGSSLTVKDALKIIGLDSVRDLLPGLEVRLLEHQIIGVAWMLEQERKSRERGGILADEMGLGKTVQMIATMIMNPPKPDSDRRTTLIVVPAALLQQWKEELETKTNDVFTVHVHHSTEKLKTLDQIKSKDVIITSFQTLTMDFNLPKGLDPDDEMEWVANNSGVLARTKWYRVIIDEAQFIRNRATVASRCVAMLLGRYRWLLTGTPVTNTLADVFGLLRFGHFRPFNDWDDFRRWIADVQVKDAPLAAERAQAVLKPLLLRRNKNSRREDGQPVLQLPPKDIEIVKLRFSKDEKQLYDIFEGKTQVKINKFIKAGTLLKNHSFVLVLILRLRQLCGHPHLVLQHTEEDSDPTLLVGSQAEKELAHATRILGAAWVKKVKERFLIRAEAFDALDFPDEDEDMDNTCPACHDFYLDETGRVLACGHEICFDCLLELKGAPLTHDGEFGHGNDKENSRAEKEYETAVAKGYRPCPTCKKLIDVSDAKVFKSFVFEPSREELVKYRRTLRRKNRSKRRASDDEDDEDMRPPPSQRAKVIDDSSDSGESDEEMPDLHQLLAERKKASEIKKDRRGKYHSESEGEDEDNVPSRKERDPALNDDDVIDLTLNDVMVGIPPATPGLSRSSTPTSNSEGSQHATEGPMRGVKASPSVNTPGNDKNQAKPQTRVRGEPSDATIARWRKGDFDLEPSVKMLALIKLLQEWNASGDKCICFSQWTSMLDLVEILFSRYGIRSLRYDGRMDRTARDSTLATFRKPGGPKVILISIKCGGVGLNLVSANRVINLDLSWNYASESQAYDRVHRLGQEKNVYVKRLVVEDTLEERMLTLQDVKTGLAEAALGEGAGTRLHKLSVKDIKFLFGMTKKPPAPAADDANAPLNVQINANGGGSSDVNDQPE